MIAGEGAADSREPVVQLGSTSRVLWLGFGSVLLLVLLLLGLALHTLHKMERRLEAIAVHGVERAALIQEMHGAARERALLLAAIMNESDPFVRDEHMLRHQELAGHFVGARRRLIEHGIDATEQAIIARQSRAAAESQARQDEVLALASAGRLDAAQTLFVHYALPQQEQMLRVLAELSDYTLRRAKAESQEASAANQKTRLVVWWGGGTVVLLGIGVASWVRRRILRLMQEREQLTQELQDSLRDLSFQKQAMDEHAIVSITDAAGDIVYVNDKFCRISGYERSELLGRNHRLLKSGRQDQALFDEMWKTISAGRVWHGDVCNRAKNGSLYWVKTTIVPFLDGNGLPNKYVSIRTDITVVKEAEDMLQASRDDLSRQVSERTAELRQQLHFNTELMEALPNPIFYKNIKGHFLGVNKAWEAFFGIPRERVVGKQLDEIAIMSADAKRNSAAMDDVLLRDGGEQRYEMRITVAGSEMRDVMYYKAALTNAQGRISGLVGSIVDMTEYRQAEQTLSQFKSTLDRIQDCVFMFSPETLRFFYVNHGAVEQVGYSIDELMAMTPLDLKCNLTELQFRRMLRPLLDGACPALTFETVHRHKDGHEIPVEVVLQYVQTADMPRFVAVVRDITEHKRVAQVIKESEEKFRSIYECSNDAIMLLSEQGFFDCNARTLEIFALASRDEFISAHPSQMSPPVQPNGQDSLSASNEKIALAFAQGWARFDWMHRRSNGEDFPAEVLLTAFDYQGKRVLQATVRDITERKRTEAELKQRYEDVQALNTRLQEAQHQLLQSEKMASIGQLAAGVAHEINNPIGYVFSNLGTLRGYLHELLEVVAAYEAAEAHVAEETALAAVKRAREKADLAFLKSDIEPLMGECHEGITRVKKIVQDLKDFSRIDSSDEWQWADLHHGLDTTLNIVRNELKYKATIVKAYGDLPEVECLPSQLNQVYLNLLVNAGHAIEEQGTITLRSGAEGERVWVEVEDTGKGIAPENLRRIFDPFFTTKPVGTGTGLGLSLSYGIVQKHHGEIEVESTLGQGTRFRVWLPIKQQEDAEALSHA